MKPTTLQRPIWLTNLLKNTVTISINTFSQVFMMMTNLDDVLVSDIRNLGLNMEERFLHTEKPCLSIATKLLSYACLSLTHPSQPITTRFLATDEALDQIKDWRNPQNEVMFSTKLRFGPTSICLFATSILD